MRLYVRKMGVRWPLRISGEYSDVEVRDLADS
jgi:hypothetical protein